VCRHGRIPRVALAGTADVALGRLLDGVADGDAEVHAKLLKKAGKTGNVRHGRCRVTRITHDCPKQKRKEENGNRDRNELLEG
jgi:hypothetical protein